MPQYLYFEIRDKRVATMQTSHLSGTCYDIKWCRPAGPKLSLPGIDTGVQCQPEDPIKRKRDFQNDFSHARRAIAAASLTAKQFLDKLAGIETHRASDFEVVRIRLRTNSFDRGTITIRPQKGGTAKLHMEIGTGPERPPGAQPLQVSEFSEAGVDVGGATSPLALALQVLDSEGSWLLNALAGNT